jgi:hypothetical protein
MNKTERVRQEISGALSEADFKQRMEKGWKLVAIEWEREVETAEEKASEGKALDRMLSLNVPFGLKLDPETARLEENPGEREILFNLMELMMQEGSYARIADEINRRGYRTRQGLAWSPVSVFEMLPRLIEVGPQVFQSAEWQERRQISQKVL